MSRVTISEVENILPDGSQLKQHQIQAAIDAATCTVDQMVDSCGSHLNENCLKQVEKYLAAHYAAVTENTLTIKSENDPCSGGSVTYGFKFGEGIMGTPFGQTANTISGGCLGEMDKKPVDIITIGTI